MHVFDSPVKPHEDGVRVMPLSPREMLLLSPQRQSLLEAIEFFNAQQTVWPQAYTAETCRLYFPRLTNGNRVSAQLALKMRGFLLRNNLMQFSVYWGTRRGFERLHGIKVQDGSVPFTFFSRDGEAVELFNAEQTDSCDALTKLLQGTRDRR